MRLRSLLFVPGDSERKFAKASASAADALILDLEDAVAPGQKASARAMVSALLDRPRDTPWAFFVRVNPLDSGLMDDDLAAVVKPGLDGVLIPKANGAADIACIAAKLDRLERAAGMASGTIRIAVVATETPLAMFNLGSYT
ncbi:MAG: aldolase/citrate lyase family protein, partial [Sphingopyxis sp.]